MPRRRAFLRQYLSHQGLRNLLAKVFRRLTGAGGEVASILRLDTSYGGGKTHGLIVLHHAVLGMQGVSDVSEFVAPSLLPRGPVRVVAYDGENADPTNGREMGDGVFARTPWGKIAHALAGKAGCERLLAMISRSWKTSEGMPTRSMSTNPSS